MAEEVPGPTDSPPIAEPVDVIFDAGREADRLEFALESEWDSLRRLSESLYRDLFGCLYSSMTVWDDCARTVALEIIRDLNDWTYLYGALGDVLEAVILGELGYVTGLAPDAPIAPIGDSELALIAGGLPLPVPGMPAVPSPQPPPQWIPPGPIGSTPIGDTPYGLPQFPAPPPEWGDYLRPPSRPAAPGAPVSPPPSAPTGAPDSLPPAGPTAPTGAPGTPGPSIPPSKARPPVTSPPTGGLTDGEMTGTDSPGAPGRVPVPPVSPVVSLPPAALPPAVGTIQAGAGGATPEGEAGFASGGCPPVHVHVHCAPGVTAGEGDQPPGNAPVGAPGPPGRDGTKPFEDMTDKEQILFLLDYVRYLDPRFSGQAAAAATTDKVRPALDKEGLAPAQKLPTIKDVLSTIRNIDTCDVPALDKAFAGWIDRVMVALWGDKDAAKVTKDSIVGSVTSALPSWLESVVNVVLVGLQQYARFPIYTVQTVTGCESPSLPALSLITALLGALQRWVGVDIPQLSQRVDQARNQVCPVGLPGPDDADSAFLTGQINLPVWQCWVRAAGMNDDAWLKVWQAKKTRLSPLQYAEAQQRLGKSDSWLIGHARHAGMVDWEDVSIAQQLVLNYPSAQDIVSFMVRDVFDEAVVKEYGYDKEFDDKLQGKADEFARIAGTTRETMRLYWRAHWQLPSPTQAYEFLHRLRPGRVPDDVVTTAKDVDRLLGIADIPEYFRRRLMAVSYLPLTRVDIRRAYFQGSLTEEETLAQILDRGYNDRDANLLLNYWRLERVQWLKSRREYREFVEGFTPDDAFRDQLGRLGFSAADRLVIESEAERDTTLRGVRTQAKGIRQRVLRGLLDWGEAITALVAIGFSGGRASQLARQWDGERQARGKHATIAQLCAWWDKGWISDEEYADALARIGYSPSQIGNIIRQCRDKSKVAAERQKRAEEVKEKAKEKRELSDAHKAALARNRAKAAETRARRVEQAAMERVQRRLAGSAADLAKRLGGVVSDYLPGVREWFTALRNDRGYTPDGASQMIAGVVVDRAVQGSPQWKEAGSRLIELLPSIGTARE